MRARATLVFLVSFLAADQSDYHIRINSAIDDLGIALVAAEDPTAILASYIAHDRAVRD